MTNKDWFIQAFLEADAVEMQKFQNKENFLYEFSEAFEKKMSKLISKESRISFNTRRRIVNALIAALIASLLLITGLLSVSASRQKIVEFIENVFSTNTQITLSENSAPTPETIEKAYTLGYVPEGFELKQYELEETSVFAIWQNKNGEQIVFVQVLLDGNFSIDNEHIYNKTEIKGFPAYIYGDKYTTELSWSDGEYRFIVQASTIYKSELLSMAENISENN